MLETKMKKSLFAISALVACSLFAAPDVTNTVMMVDQNKNLNVEGVASVEEIATNRVATAIAEQKAEAAQSTAIAVSNAIQSVVGNIMSNNVVIYRSGFSDSFSSLVIITDSDTYAISDCDWNVTPALITATVRYVCTANLGTSKPLVYTRNTVVGGRENFDLIADADVTTPVFNATEVVYNGQTFSGYYETTVTINNPSSTSSYFLWIKANPDTPSGDGTTLDLPNGVTGGATGTVDWGGYRLQFVGGVLTGVSDAE